MPNKLKGHALENYNMVKKVLDSNKPKEEIEKELISLQYKGGNTMKEKALCAIKEEMKNHEGYDTFKLMLEVIEKL